jgi:hypothetical protein
MPDQRSASALPNNDVSPAERSMRARLAAHTLHARRDARQTTATARVRFLAKFEREVDPDGALDPRERRRRAEHARRAYFIRLSLAALEARRARRTAQARSGVA